MFSFLANLKTYLPIILIIFGVGYGTFWHYRYDNAQAEILQLNEKLAVASTQLELQNKAVLHLKDESRRLSQEYKLKDLENAKRASESQKRVTSILNMQLPSDCNQAIRYVLKSHL